MPFRPVDVIRQLEAEYGALAEAGNGTFEAFGSLGCENGRIGDPEALIAIIRGILGTNPFTAPDRNLRLKISAKARKPVVLDLSNADDPLQASPGVEALIARMEGSLAPLPGGALRVTLPLAEVEIADAQDDAAPQGESENLAGMRILIADDSPTNRLVLEEMLGDTQARLTCVTDGKEALDSWQAGEYDLLLLDISMPVMDGVTAIREIRTIEQAKGMSPIAAVAVTANALVNQVADYLVAGFDTHLAKPFRRKDLMHAILTLRKS